LQRFLINPAPNGVTLGTPFTNDRNQESGDKCLYTGNAEGNAIWSDRCNTDNPWQVWELKSVGGGRSLLVHKLSGRCAKPQSRSEGSSVETLGSCDANNVDFLWSTDI